MSWHTLTHRLLKSGDRTTSWAPVPMPRQTPQPTRSLGAATADAHWRWTSPHVNLHATATVALDASDECVATRLVVTRELRAEMAEMAHVLGRSEDDIWAEAAREWLLRRLRNDEPPPTTPAAASAPNVRTRRMWSEIDAMLAELRHPRYVAIPAEPAEPAA